MGNIVEKEAVAAVPEERPADNRQLRYTDQQKKDALAHVDSGMSYRKAAARISSHISAATISRWVKERKEFAVRSHVLEAYPRNLLRVEMNEFLETLEQLQLQALQQVARARPVEAPVEQAEQVNP